MLRMWEEIRKKNGKKIAIAAGALCALFLCGFLVANAQKINVNFNPERLADNRDEKDNSVDYDSTVFNSQASDKDGMEMDRDAEDKYKLNEGEQDVLDRQDERNQQGLTIGDGSGTGNGNANGVNVTNDGQGPVIAGNGGLNGAGGAGQNGSGNGNGGNGGGTNVNDPEDQKVPENPHESQYGIDYSEQEKVDTFTPDQGVSVTGIKVTRGSLMQHFYEGEAPRIEEMDYYLTVRATLSDGTSKTLHYRASDATGGDYTVKWSGNTENVSNDIGYPKVGEAVGSYTAVIEYGKFQISIPYDIVHWQVTLKDFEGENRPDDTLASEYAVFPVTVSPEETPFVQFSNAATGDDYMQSMYNLMAARTQTAKENAEFQYQHQNVKKISPMIDWFGDPVLDDDGNPIMVESEYCYVEYFGGWKSKEEAGVCGNGYRMKRPAAEDIKDGIYNVDMEPTWHTSEDEEEFTVSLNGSLERGEPWATELLRYSGDSTTLVIPEGVTTLNFGDYRLAEEGGSDQADMVKKLVIPASLDAFEFYEEGWPTSFEELFPNLEEIEVSADNKSFLSIDGILYNKTGKKLLYVPAMKTEVKEWSSKVITIGSNAFRDVSMEKVEVPKSVNQYDEYCFFNAAFEKLVLNGTDPVTIGESAFDSDRGSVQIHNISIKAKEILDLDGYFPNWFAMLNWNNINYKDAGLKITVADSKDDTLYLNMLRTLSGIIDENSQIIGNTWEILGTESGAEKNYKYQDGLLLSEDGKQLYMASTLLSGGVSIPDGVEKIEEGALVGCNNISILYVPAKVQKIDTWALANMPSLQTIYMFDKVPPEISHEIFGDEIPDGLQIYVDEDARNSYIAKDGQILDADYGQRTAETVFAGMKDLAGMIENDGNFYYVNEDGSYSLYKVRDSFKGIFMPMEGTVKFMDACFAGHSELSGVVLPETLREMGHDVFAGCTALEVIASNKSTIPSMEPDTFEQEMPAKITVYIPKSAPQSEWSGFGEVKAQGNSYISNTENSGNGAIYTKTDKGSKLLYAAVLSSDTFTLRGDTVEIGEYSFTGKTMLSGVTNGESVSQIEDSAFEGCTNLRFVDVKNVTVLGRAAFKDCIWLSNLMGSQASSFRYAMTIPGGVTTIAAQCFEGCTQIQKLRTSQLLINIGEAAFRNCTSLLYFYSQDPEDGGDKIAFPYNANQVPVSCFEGCVKLAQIYIPEGVTEIGDRAFYGCTALNRSRTKDWDETEYIFEFSAGLNTFGQDCFSNTGLVNVTFEKRPAGFGTLSVQELMAAYFNNSPVKSFKISGTDLLAAAQASEQEPALQAEPEPKEQTQSVGQNAVPQEFANSIENEKDEKKPETTEGDVVSQGGDTTKAAEGDGEITP